MTQGNAVDWFVDRHTRDGGGAHVAFQDPWRSLTYAALDTATRQFAGALQIAGIGRERRILLLLQDTIDFPIAFWGALRAGVVPVPINTLLTPKTVAYILQDSRAAGVVISAGLTASLPADAPHHVIVSEPDGSRQPTLANGNWTGFQAFLADGDPATPAVAASPDEVAFWLYSSGSTGAPKGVRHVHSSLRFTAETYGAQRAGGPPRRRHVLRCKGLSRLRAWQQPDVSPIGRRNDGVPAGSADAGGRAGNDAHAQPDAVRRHPDPVRGAARQSLHHAGCRLAAPAPLHLSRRGVARGYRQPVEVDRRGRYPRRDRFHRNAAHLHQQPSGRYSLRHQWKAGAGV